MCERAAKCACAAHCCVRKFDLLQAFVLIKLIKSHDLLQGSGGEYESSPTGGVMSRWLGKLQCLSVTSTATTLITASGTLQLQAALCVR